MTYKKSGGVLMKKCIIVTIAVLCSFLSATILFAAADTWTQKADFGGAAREGAVGFSIGSKGYIGTGLKESSIESPYQHTKDFWEYDPAANTWTQKADFGGQPLVPWFSIGVIIGRMVYGDLGIVKEDFWEYDPAAVPGQRRPILCTASLLLHHQQGLHRVGYNGASV
jgi:hypothetical protein